MIKNKKFSNAINNIPQSTPPIWFMRQAGRYHSHYQSLRRKYSFVELCKTPNLAAEVAMGPINDFDYDVAILFSDILFPLESLGLKLDYAPGPVFDRFLEEDDIIKTPNELDVIHRYNFQAEALRLTRASLSEEKSLVGFVGGPWTLLSYGLGIKDEEKIEAVAINPTLVIGASLSDDVGTSNIFLQKMLDGSYPVVPKVHFGYVTVKDTAKAHVAAMTHPHASGKRFILAERCMWLYEVNKILRKHGYKKAPIRQAPNLLMKFLALFNNEASAIAGFVGKTKFTNSENAKNILKFSFENVEVGILEIAQQLESLGVIKK